MADSLKEQFAAELDTLMSKYSAISASEIKEVLDRVQFAPVVQQGTTTKTALKSPKKDK